MKNLLISLSLLLFCTLPAAAAEIRLSAAASLTEAVKALLVDYQQRQPEAQVLANFAASGALAKQIQAGAPADIYISANPKWMDYLQQQGLIADASRTVLVQNRLVFVGAQQTAISCLAQLPSLQRIAICSPRSSPAGQYAEQALIAAGVYPQLVVEQQLILAKDVRQALLYADRGEVDGAFVYQTDALLAQRAKTLFTVPAALYPQIEYPAALTSAGSGNPAAAEFFAYLLSAPGQQYFQQHGFLLP